MIVFLLPFLQSPQKRIENAVRLTPFSKAKLKVDTLTFKKIPNPLYLQNLGGNAVFFSKGNLCHKRGAK